MSASSNSRQGNPSRTEGHVTGFSGAVLNLIGDRLAAHPDAAAINCGDAQALSYAELWQRAEAIADGLAGVGVRPGHVVPVMLPRSTDTVAALLGIWMAGAVYVPLDPAFPAERIEFILRDCGSAVLLTHSDLASTFAAAVPDVIALDAPLEPTDRSARPNSLRPAADDLAYTIYTSGSTGSPKGVQVTHRSLLNFTLHLADLLHLGDRDVFTSVVSPAFDVSLIDYLVPLLSGARISVIPQDSVNDAERLGRLIAANGATVMQATPVTWQILRESDWRPPGLFTALSGGEALPADLATWIRDRCAKGINLYGPTEATIYVSTQDLSQVDLSDVHTVPLGEPIAGVAFYVVTENGTLAPFDTPGELCISGVALARGYVNRPGEMERAFVPNPFRLGERMYRTGDLVKRRNSGALEFLGRIDHQVKVRGHRIELGEVEATLSSHPAVRQSVIVAREYGDLDKRLVAYVRPMARSREQRWLVLAGELREFAAGRLPGYMVPSSFVVVDEFPLTPNGKIDRGALPDPGSRPDSVGVFVAPRDEVERQICELWADLLGIGRVGVEDDFFVLGGHSLLAAQMGARLRGLFGVGVSVRDVFEAPTVVGLARLVGGSVRQVVGDGTEGGLGGGQIVPRSDTGPAPLSFAQRRLWFLQQLDPASVQYNLWSVLRLCGPLDRAALEGALVGIVRRHAVLRTTFTVQGGEPLQVVHSEPLTELQFTDLAEEAGADEARVRALVGEYIKRPFDLWAEAPIRTHLIRLAPDEHYLVISQHHIASDAWSQRLLVDELRDAYEARPAAASEDAKPEEAELCVQYGDFAVWQREWLSGERLDADLAYWRGRLAGLEPVELPLDRPRPAVRSGLGRTVYFDLGPGLYTGLMRVAQESRASLFMTLLAAYQVLLSRYSGQDDIAVGVPIANRHHAETEKLIGFFVNTLVLRSDLSGNPSFADLVAQVREHALDAYEHQDLPFERLVEELQPERDLSRTPLFQTMFQIDTIEHGDWRLSDLGIEEIQLPSQSAKFDLSLHLTETNGVLSGRVEFATDLFSVELIEAFVGHFRRLLECVVADPGVRVREAEFLSDDERDVLVSGWNATGVAYPEKCLHEWIEEQAVRSPGAVAVVHGDVLLTYGELEAEANRLARHLADVGVGVEDAVAVFVPRGVDLAVASLAVLKAGGVYVPLDPDLPVERLRFVLRDAGVRALVSYGDLVEDLAGDGVRTVLLDEEPAAGLEASRPVAEVGPGNAAYVIYTSGSTGVPKGAVIEHRSIANNLLWMQRNWPLYESDGLLQKTACGFDVSVKELFWPLMFGARLVFADPDGHKDPGYLLDVIRQHKVTVAHFVPSMLRLFLEQEGIEGARSLRLVMCGAEKLAPGLLAEFQHKLDADLLHMYGPTETTIAITGWLSSEAEDASHTVPLGRPSDNTQLYVLDADDRLVPPGVAGELCVSGIALARGYLNRPEETERVFVPNPFLPGERMYRTGDLVRYRRDGVLEFLGRRDHQVKVRGFRIELGEIEATLAAHPSVQQTLVTAHQDTAHETRLTAYYTCADGRRCAPRSLREHLAESLPGYMIPSAFVWLEALPLTANGKTDFRALPEADPADVATAEYVAPRTPAEETLAALWAELLKVSRVGIDDDFFELGGHSLLATQFVSRAKAAFGFDVPLRSVFEASTIRVLGPVVAVLAAQWLADNFGPADTELAAAKPQQAKEPKKPMQNEDRTRRSELPPLQPADRSRPLPLSFAQQRFWFLDQLEESREEYQIALAVRLTGDLDRPALERAFQDVIRRHEALRTTLTGADGTPVQTIRDPEDVPALKWTDLSASPQAEARRQTEQITADDGRATFDLAMDLPIRGRLIRVTPHEHTFSLTIHHVAADGWSRDVLVDELAALYTAHRTNTPSPLPELCVQYGDFAVWQREWLSGERLDADLAYWRGRLAGLEPVELPLDRPRPAVRSGLGRTVYFDLGPGLYTGLMRVAQESRASLFMTLLAAYQVLLSRYSGQADIAVGVPIANRHHAETEKLIGFFVNTLVLRSDLSGNPSFADLVAQVREHALDAYEHQDLPFERLVEELQPERDLSRTPLFQTMFQLRTPRNSWEFFGLEAEEQHVPWTTSMYDLTLEISDEDGVLSGRVEFATDLFSVELIEAFVGHFRRLLECVVADPGVRVREAEFLSDDERDVLVSGWNATGVAYPEKCLHEWIEEQAVRSPGAVAVVHGDVLLTYGELEAEANRLARHLADVGVGVEDAVAVFVPRGVDLAVASLAVLKAGGVYVPLDPDLPVERLRFVLRDAGVRALVSYGDLVEDLAGDGVRTVLLDEEPAAGLEASRPVAEVGPGNAAYVIYTSGSTGVPKGAVIEHRSIANNLLWMQRNWPLYESDGLLQKTACGFDVSVKELFWPLMFGARLVFADPDGHKDPGYLLDVIRQHKVTVAHFVPSMLRLFLEQEGIEGARSLRLVMCGAEKLAAGLLAEFQHKLDADLLHMYGPTETTIAITGWLSSEAEDASHTVPLGRPSDNTQLYVLDADDRLVPPGVAGELCVSGIALARGYLNRPEETERVFVPNPFLPGERMYRTGDLVRYRRDGVLEFLGRRDHQVKVRGFRIELGEIEATLAAHPSVQQTLVTAHQYGDSGTRLAAYVRPTARSEEVPVESRAARAEQVDYWRGVFEKVDETAVPTDVHFDITGWDSSYTWEPISADDMAEWVDTTVGRILEYRPRRVLEIGCGSGLLIWRVAPECDSYVALDFSQATLDQLGQALSEAGLDHVELFRREATQLDGIGEGFDVIVLNSVLQYFPDLEYLDRVLTSACGLLRDGGVFFAGDVRHLGLLDEFRSSVELYRAPVTATVGAFRERVARGVAREEELLVAPRYFTGAVGRIPRVTGVEVMPRRGRKWNEMTAFRYDAALHVGVPGGAQPAVRVDTWLNGAEPGAASARWLTNVLVAAGGEPFGVLDWPYDRLTELQQALNDLERADDEALVGEVVDRGTAVTLGQPAASGTGIDEMERAAAQAGYRLLIDWSRTPDALDLAFLPQCEATDTGLEGTASGQDGADSYPRLVRWPDAPADSPTGPAANDPVAVRSREQRWLVLAGELREFAAGRLPGYMVPSSFVVVDEFPLTPNGKIDRGALPDPGSRPDSVGVFVAPRDEVERQICELWADLLGIGRVGVEDDFFVLGGHSLLAAQMGARLRGLFGVGVSVRDVFEAPTVVGLARLVGGSVRQVVGDGTEGGLGGGQIVPRSDTGPAPLSFAQRRLWFLQQLDPASVQYNLWSVLRLCGPLDRAALEGALVGIVRRHAVLRTTFTVQGGEPLQVVHSEPLTELQFTDLAEEAGADEARVRALVGEYIKRPFDLWAEAPIRTHLIRLAPDEHYLVISQHHIASDAWSHNIFIKELNTLYRPLADLEPTMALTPTLEPLPLQYADFAYWESRQESRAAVDKDLIYWRERLDGTQTLALPTDFPHTSSPDERAGVIEFSIPEGLVAELDRLSQERQASVFMLLLAAYQVLLSRYSGQDDIAVGVPVANRNRAETENLIGFFVNTLVLRSDLSGDQSFTDLLAQVREHALDAYEHQDLPFERLVEELQPERDLSRTPLFQTMFQLDHGEIADWSLDGLSTEELTFRPQGTKFDLILDATRREGGLACQFTYRSNLFEAATVERLGEHYRVVLQEIADNVSVSLNELDIRTPRERAAAAGTHGIPVPVAVPTVPERLAEMAANIPDQPAVTHGDACLTYGQLHEQSSRLARRLVAHGVGLESPVAVFLERGTDHLVAALAVMKAGGVYVPVDPQIPSEQAAFIVDDVDARVVLVHNATAANVAGDGDGRNILSVSTAETDNTEIAGAELFSSAPDNAAYVIYTSGSTGHPKGVVIEHRSLANLVDSLQEAHRLAVGEPTLHKTSTMFDVHIQEMLWPLAVGAHVVVADHGREGDVRYLADLMRRHGVTTAGFVPSLLRTFVDDDRAGDLPALRRIFSAGEVLTRDLARRVIDRYGCELYNLYGPAETTVYVTMGRILHDDVVTIGKPLDQVRLYVVDRTGRPAPTGAPGELLVAGVQVGRGYVNRPELTAERFVDNPVSGAPAGKAYRTGDAARYLPDGRIEFLGRLDEQMKIRGHRVEPEEIESAVDSFAGVAESAVVIKEHAPGDNRLHAYVVLEPGRTSASPQPLREYLASRLVQSLVPNFFNVVESLPRTISGKIDRNRLRSRIEVAYDTGQQMSGAPRTLEEWLVASAFGEVLDRPQPGPDANFFDLGGHSLLAAALVVKIHAASGVDVPLAEIFRRPTVAGLADLLAGGQEGQRKVDSSVLVPLDVRASGKPIFCVHPVGGGIFCYADLARRLTRSRPVLGLQAHGLDPAQEPDRSIEDMAARYLREIDSAGYEGPYTLLGWSFGGAVAFEMARQLGAAAGEVDLVLLDSLPPGCPHASDEDIAVAFVEDLASMHSLTDVPAPASGSVFDAFERAREHGLVPESLRLGSFARRVEVYGANLRAAAAYRPSPAQVETTLYRPSHSARSLDEGWSFLTAGRLSAREITGDHYEILRDPNLGQWTENLLVKE